jgi:hypothetical protein
MLRALHLPPHDAAVPERSLLDEHNVASVLARPFAKKVPHLILYLKDVLPAAGNVFAKFVDPTGKRPLWTALWPTLTGARVVKVKSTARFTSAPWTSLLAASPPAVSSSCRKCVGPPPHPQHGGSCGAGWHGTQVSVFNPTPRTTYLNITRENVVTVFAAEHAAPVRPDAVAPHCTVAR